MPSSMTIYAPGAIMEEAFITSATSEATGHLKECLTDGNPNTYWKMAAAGTNSVVVDLASAKAVQGWAVMLRNYSVDMYGSLDGQIEIAHSPDNSNWTVWETVDFQNALTNPIYFGSLNLTAATKRYWRFKFIAPTVIPEVAAVYLWTAYSIVQGNEYPENDEEGYLTDEVETRSGARYTTLLTSGLVRTIPRQFTFASGTDWNSLTLVTAFRACRANFHQFILVEDGSLTGALLVKFDNRRLVKNEGRYRVYRPQVVFVTVPYIQAGYTI